MSASDAQSLASASAGSLDSLQDINNLSSGLQTVVRDAFRDATRWCFISLIPWAAVAFILTLKLSSIPDTDRKQSRSDSSAELNDLTETRHERG